MESVNNEDTIDNNKEYKLTFKFNDNEHVVTRTDDLSPFIYDNYIFYNIFQWIRYIKKGDIPISDNQEEFKMITIEEADEDAEEKRKNDERYFKIMNVINSYGFM